MSDRYNPAGTRDTTASRCPHRARSPSCSATTATATAPSRPCRRRGIRPKQASRAGAVRSPGCPPVPPSNPGRGIGSSTGRALAVRLLPHRGPGGRV